MGRPLNDVLGIPDNLVDLSAVDALEFWMQAIINNDSSIGRKIREHIQSTLICTQSTSATSSQDNPSKSFGRSLGFAYLKPSFSSSNW